jgi:acetyltransferase-like isoleucine patch superfamily enzyme
MYEINIQIKKLKFIGDKVIFKGAGEIFHPWNISIGNHVQIGTNCFLMGIGGIEIGDGTIISRNVCIHSGNHDFKSSEMIPYNSSYLKGKITIGKGVWIGQNVNILPGVTIGDGAIIGMGTTVSKDVPKYAIVVGAGQRIIGERDKDFFEEGLSSENYYGKEY